MPELIYLSGPPGVGKSTLMGRLTRGLTRTTVRQPIPHQLLGAPPMGVPTLGVELGVWRPSFPGTDTLSMSVQPKAIAWLRQHPAELILGEGDRLSTLGFLSSAADFGYRVTLVNLTAEQATLDAHRTARASNQGSAWMRGRATKATRLAAWAEQRGGIHIVDLTVDGQTPHQLATTLRGQVPALASLPYEPF